MKVEASLADVIRCEALAPDAAAREWIYALFGVTPVRTTRIDPPAPIHVQRPLVPTKKDVPSKPSVPQAKLTSVQATLRETPTARASATWRSAPVLPDKPERAGTPERPSLLATNHRAAVLGGIAATYRPTAALDLDAVIATIARGNPLSQIPRLVARRVASYVQLLVDRGDGMLPYAADLEEIETHLRRVVGRDGVDAASFARTPLHPRRFSPWKAPPRGTPVIVLTDFGIGGPAMSRDRASTAEWLAFADAAAIAGCIVVVLSPFEHARIPPALTSSMRCVHWDRTATARSALR